MGYLLSLLICFGSFVCRPAEQAEVPVPVAPAADTTLTITYLANEGLLLCSADAGVLIDVLFRAGIDPYAKVPPDALEAAEMAQPPYDVDAVLVSHPHRDHFDPASVARHLENNPSARLISSQQVVDAVQGVDAEMGGQMVAVTPDWGQRDTVQAGGARIDVLRIRHGSRRNYGIHNLGHIIELGGKKVLHIGDAEMDPAHFAPFNLPDAGVDVALIPFWFLTDATGRSIVNQHIRPNHIIAVHLPPSEAARWGPVIRSHYPAAQIARQSGQQWYY